jgi:hypothetical protein
MTYQNTAPTATSSPDPDRGQHLVPIYEAVRDFGCRLALVLQGFGPFDPPPSEAPTIFIVGDDLDEVLGPTAFHQPSLREALQGIGLAAVVACEPLVDIYAEAARHATLLRKNVVIVETGPAQELTWINLIREIAPNAALLIGSVGGEA